MHWRLSLLESAGLVAVAAFVLAALRTGTPLWVAVAGLSVFGYLCTALVGVALRRGAARGFWAGFAVFGWMFFLMFPLSFASSSLARQLDQALNEAVDALVPPPAVPQAVNPAVRRLAFQEAAQYKVRVGVIAELGLNLAFAYLGGAVGLTFAARPGDDRRAAS